MSTKVNCAAIVKHESGILLVSETGKNKVGQFNLPSGSVDAGETLLHCMVRETFEESGLIVEPDYLVGIYNNPETKASNNLTRFVFAATVVGGYLQQSDKHPVVGYYDELRIAGMDELDLLTGQGTLRAINDFHRGARYDLDIITQL